VIDHRPHRLQLDLLTDMVNYASNLGIRCYTTSTEQQLRDVIVCFVLLKQFAGMLDAVEVLARAGAINAAFVPARAAFEASLYIEWTLVADGEKKTTHYVVGNFRAERLWAKRVAKGTPEASTFLTDMGDIGKDILAQRTALDADSDTFITEADRILAQPGFAETNAAFGKYIADHPRRRGGEPEWYRVMGKPSVRSIAKELMRLPDCIVYYGKGSQVVHSASYKEQISFRKGGAVAHPIRNVADTHTLFNFVCSNAIYTFTRVLGFYRPEELPKFGAMYIAHWRGPFTNIPRMKIQSTAKKPP
jgi:hypothetical protein